MGKRRRVKTSGQPKVNSPQKEKSTKRQISEKNREKDRLQESREATVSGGKKQKLETSQTESEAQLEKYVPPFTASQRVVRLGRDKLSLNKTEVNSLEKSVLFKNTDNKDSIKDDKYDNPPENDGEIVTPSKKDQQQTVSGSTDCETVKRNAIRDDVSRNNCEDEDMREVETNKVEKSMSVKDVAGTSLGSSELSMIQDNHVLEPDQTIMAKEQINDYKPENATSQTPNDLKPINSADVVLTVVPKLSELIKKYYINIEENVKVAGKPVATRDTINSSRSFNSESPQETERANAELVEPQRESMDVTDIQKSNLASNTNKETCSQLNSETAPSEVTSFETECSTELKEVEKEQNLEKLQTDLRKNDVHDDRNDQPSVSVREKQTEEQNAQEVAAETPKEAPSSKASSIAEEQPASSSNLETTTSNVSKENKPDNQNENDISTSSSNLETTTSNASKENQPGDQNDSDISALNSVANNEPEQQSFAKEFEVLEKLLPKDDMGLFDDVIDNQLKSTSDEKKMPEGDSTMEFLINELSSLSCMVMMYQREVEEMKRHYKFSGRC